MTTSDARARMALSITQDEHRRVAELLEIIKQNWRAENLRAEHLQARLNLVTPVVEAAEALVQNQSEQYERALATAVGDYQWKLKNQ